MFDLIWLIEGKGVDIENEYLQLSLDSKLQDVVH